MLPDYYYILRVDPTADQATVKAAYRHRAKECHPDRGGRHREMVLVNEAWEILKDPGRRAVYDLARKSATACSVVAVSPDIAAARTRAASYPARWAEFEKWLDEVGQDFQAAEWTTWKFLGNNVPESRRSATARIFLISGTVLGSLLGAGTAFRQTRQPPITAQFAGRVRQPAPRQLRWLALINVPWMTLCCGLCGVWLGKWLHVLCARALLIYKRHFSGKRR